MNRINPIHIGILLIVILLFVAVKLSSAKSELQDVKDEYKTTLLVASKVSGLKAVYADKKKIQIGIKRVLDISSLKSANIEQKIKKDTYILSSESMDKNSLNILMGKLLNASYNISSFKIKKLSSEKVSFDMEIKW